MAKISIYISGSASRANYDNWAQGFSRHLFRHDLNIKSPDSLGTLREEIKKDLTDNTEYIFSVGGDGSANQIIQSLVGKNIKLLVVPTGTANDLATELGINSSIRKIVKIFQHKSTKKIDVLRVGDRYMLTNGGVGLASQVANKVNTYRNSIPGFKGLMGLSKGKIYSLTLIKELLSFQAPRHNYTILSEDFPLTNNQVESPLILINNQPLLGSNFIIAPDTINDDGKFNVCIFTHKKHMDLVNCIYKIRVGKFPYTDENLIRFETSELEIISNDGREMSFFGDGEVLESRKSIKVENVPRSLEVCSYDKKLMYCHSYNLEEIEAL